MNNFIKNFLKKRNIEEKISQDYYMFPPSCQISKLGRIYENYFGQIKNGVFVEIGAYDGEYASNTCGLADLGWEGYYIEPVPEYFLKCTQRHAQNKNIIISNCAIGDDNRQVTIHVGGPLSTISPKALKSFHSLKWAQGLFRGEKVKTNQITLDNFLIKNPVPPGFELLVIDVEGYEWNVLKKFNLLKWRPQMVIIELHDQNPDYPDIKEQCNKIVQYFIKHQYKVIYKDLTNTIYVPYEKQPIY